MTDCVTYVVITQEQLRQAIVDGIAEYEELRKDEDTLLTIKEAAEFLKMKRTKFYLLRKQGIITPNYNTGKPMFSRKYLKDITKTEN